MPCGNPERLLSEARPGDAFILRAPADDPGVWLVEVLPDDVWREYYLGPRGSRTPSGGANTSQDHYRRITIRDGARYVLSRASRRGDRMYSHPSVQGGRPIQVGG